MSKFEGVIKLEVFVPVIQKAVLDSKKVDCQLNWGMPEKPDV